MKRGERAFDNRIARTVGTVPTFSNGQLRLQEVDEPMPKRRGMHFICYSDIRRQLKLW